MAFSSRTVTHTFTNIDGTPGSGTVVFTLLKQMTNSGTTMVPGSVSASIQSNGSLSQALVPNDDQSTYPEDAEYRIDIRLQAQGATEVSFVAQIPAGSGNLDLGSLFPQAEQAV